MCGYRKGYFSTQVLGLLILSPIFVTSGPGHAPGRGFFVSSSSRLYPDPRHANQAATPVPAIVIGP